MENIEVLGDGSIKITYMGMVGYVSSYHLIEPKLNQMKKWHREHTSD